LKTFLSAAVFFPSVLLALTLAAFSQETQPSSTSSQTSSDFCRQEVNWEDGKTLAHWHLIYPGTTAYYVGGTVPDMRMHKDSRFLHPMSLTGLSQSRRKGQIALTSDCLLFAFDAKGESNFDTNAYYHVWGCSNKVNLSDDRQPGATCSKVGEDHPRSYVMMIPYAKVNVLSRAKYATADLAAISAAYATAGGGILTAIYSSVSSVHGKELGVSIAAGTLAMGYYLFIATPRSGDNYIAVFIEPAFPRIILERASNTVTATTFSPHYFLVGQQIEISGVANLYLMDISKISRDDSRTVTVQTRKKHGLTVGAQIQIADCTDPSFNGQFQVASVPADSETTFTYEQKDKLKAAATPTGGKGTVQDVWNGTFLIKDVPTANTFTYWQVGPNDRTSSTKERDKAELVAGNAAVFVPAKTNLTVSGNLTQNKPAAAAPKSLDLAASLAPPPAKSDELFKKGDLVMFRIPNHHDYYNISMTLSGGTGLTFVSETAEKTGK
jgi:hypothetical protein